MEIDPARQALLDALSAHVAADGREARDVATLVSVVRASPGCFSRSHYAPGHVTGSAFVVSPDLSQVLLIHHRTIGRWLQPGGHYEPADSFAASAARDRRSRDAALIRHSALSTVPALD